MLEKFKALDQIYQVFILTIAATVIGGLILTFIVSLVKNIRIGSAIKITLTWIFVMIPNFAYRLWKIILYKLFKGTVEEIIAQEHNLNIIVDSMEIIKSSPDSQNHKEISADFLMNKQGTFVIWAYVTEEHNDKSLTKNMYIISHSGSPNLMQKDKDNNNYYRNEFAIGRLLKSSIKPWSAFSNDSSNKLKRTPIHISANLDIGWHLFCMQWDKHYMKFKFSIDCKKQWTSEIPLAGFPEYIEGKLFIGNWASIHPLHSFNSNIGPYRIYNSYLSMEAVREYYKLSKPN